MEVNSNIANMIQFSNLPRLLLSGERRAFHSNILVFTNSFLAYSAPRYLRLLVAYPDTASPPLTNASQAGPRLMDAARPSGPYAARLRSHAPHNRRALRRNVYGSRKD
ncbi:unnamed protein product, partial [Iphiclides podalirius]